MGKDVVAPPVITINNYKLEVVISLCTVTGNLSLQLRPKLASALVEPPLQKWLIIR